VLGEAGEIPTAKKWGLRFMGRLLASPKAFGLGGRLARQGLRLLPHSLSHAKAFNAWAVARELPESPRQSFREWYQQQATNGES
jgi:L-lactate dehydrogenase complex protein LldF